MSAIEQVRFHRAAILALAARYGARNVRIFGSIARGEDHPDSDLDLVVEWEERAGLFDQIALMQDTEALVGRKVDLVDPVLLRPELRQRILAEAVPL